MRRVAPLLAVAGALVAGSALAQETTEPVSVTREYAVEGDAPKFCAVGLPQLSSEAPTVNVQNLVGGVVSIATLADPATLTTRAAEFGVQVEAVCNYAHRLTITSENNGLWRDPVTGSVPAGFAGAIPYTARMDWAGAQTTLTAAAESRRQAAETALVALPNVGNVLIQVSIAQGATSQATNTPLLAGTYRDTLRVTIEPQ